MDFGKKEVKHLADLAKLELDEKELSTFSMQLRDVLNYVKKLNELDLENIPESLTGAEKNKVGPRPDKVEPSQPEAIDQACQKEGDYVVASKVFENHNKK